MPEVLASNAPARRVSGGELLYIAARKTTRKNDSCLVLEEAPRYSTLNQGIYAVSAASNAVGRAPTLRTFQAAQEGVPQGHGAVVERVLRSALALEPSGQRAKVVAKPCCLKRQKVCRRE